MMQEEEEECGICCQSYGPGRSARSLSACRHVVCARCLLSLADKKGGAVTCPFCRAPSPLPSDEEEEDAAGDVTSKGAGPAKWLKQLCRRAKAGSRRQGSSLVHNDIRDLALMNSYFM
ncbi:RING finger protein 227-like [Ascaphus truei]|uniref:RING finger protein 227-like n=1 Tax=Ascaphus truei TaxID=8439 RepID=UPI003F59224E